MFGVRSMTIAPRIFRVHGTCYYDDEAMDAPRTHTDDRLEAVAAMGYDIAWVRGDDWLQTYAMCLSTEPVQRYLREGIRDLFSAVPELAGAFVITASEHHTHCWSHVWRIASKKIDCPRCKDRSPMEMPVE